MLRAERVATSVQRAEAKRPDHSGGRDHGVARDPRLAYGARALTGADLGAAPLVCQGWVAVASRNQDSKSRLAKIAASTVQASGVASISR